MSDVSIDKVIAAYLKLRNELETTRKQYQDYEREHKEKMERLSMWLRDRADELGVESFKTEAGTAYKSIKTYARVSNWDQILEFIKSTDNWQMLEKRIAKRATIEVINELDIDPSDIGVEYGADVDFLVRKPNN